MRYYADVLQLTLRNTRLLTAGGTSFFAMQRYAPKCRRSTLAKFISSPSNVSLFWTRPLALVIIGLPSSRLHVIPTKRGSQKKATALIYVHRTSDGVELTWMRIAAGDTEERGVLALVHGDVFGRLGIEDVRRHWNGTA